MVAKREVTLSKHKNGDDLTLQSIEYWQEQGVAEIFKACWELSVLGFQMQGNNDGLKPLRKDVFVKHRVAWASQSEIAGELES